MNPELENWKLRNSFTLPEAALLILGINPDNWSEAKLLATPPKGFKVIYGKMLDDATTVIDAAVESEEIEGAYYTEYALMTDKPAKLTKLTDKEGLSILVGKTAIQSWLKANRGIPDKFFLNENTTIPNTPEKPVRESERNNLYHIIGALLLTLLEEARSNPNSEFKTQEALILHLVSLYDGFSGISKSNLEKIFPQAKRLLGFKDPG